MSSSKTPHERSFRLVCAPDQTQLVEALLNEEGFRFEPEPFSPLARKLLASPFPLGSSLAAFFGFIYIQNRSSMLPPLALAPTEGSAVLDMAASPGSKSGFLAQITGPGGFVLANEPNPARLQTLRANLACSNLLQAATCSCPGEKLPLLPDSWQFILLDPPCSGWGTANPEATRLWRANKIQPLISLQRQLLRQAKRLLAPGGLLLYSTCTTNPDENEAQTKYAMEELGLKALPIPPFAGFSCASSATGALLVEAQDRGTQGFYLSLLQKPDASLKSTVCEQPPVFTPVPEDILATPVSDPARLPPGKIAAFGNKVFFLPKQSASLPGGTLNWRGFLLGRLQNGSFVPWARLRCLLPRPEEQADAPKIILEEIASLKKLLAGQKEMTTLALPRAALWWRKLPLGICQIRNGRIIGNFPK